MDPDLAILEMKSYFEPLYDDVRLLGSGRGLFVVIGKGARGATISVAADDKGWFVELWSTTDLTTGEEELIEEQAIERREDAIRWICAWLGGTFSSS